MGKNSDLSRRVLLAAIPAAAIGAGAILPAAATLANPDAELFALGRQLESAWAHEKERYALLDKSGSNWAEAEAAQDACSKIVEKIEDLQAHTFAGIRVKVMALSWTHNGEEFDQDFFGDTTDCRLAAQIMRDLQTMGGANG